MLGEEIMNLLIHERLRMCSIEKLIGRYHKYKFDLQ